MDAAFALVLFAAAPPATGTEPRRVEVGGLPRTFYLHVPPKLPKDKPTPLVLVFHGGSGDASRAERLTKFSALADRELFLVAYPDGVGGNFNDGREPVVSDAHRDNVDDVAFVSTVIDIVSRDHRVDPKRVFATGISNGGIFSHYLAARLSEKIAAVAPVVGGFPERFAADFKPAYPVSLFILQGTADPLVPYTGGDLLAGRRGRILDTDKAAELWVEHNGCQKPPRTGFLPDQSANDGCKVKFAKWTAGRDGAEVWLYTIEGGGHTWPGGPQYMPEKAVGRVCFDVKATEAIWEFFVAHAKP